MQLTKRERDLIPYYDAVDTGCPPCNNMPLLVADLGEMGFSVKGNILDAGCGHGRLVQYVAPLPGVDRVVGFDYSPKRIARANAANKHANVSFAVGSVYDFKSDLKFDLITMFEVLEHLEQPAAAIRNMHQLLTEHGLIVGSCPINNAWKTHMKVWKNADAFRSELPMLQIFEVRDSYFVWGTSKTVLDAHQ
jgi:2-polyprenyl-3-methyl-5-hydroxy-6-metoxy-1,4-benzoquinol methylase